MKIAYIVPSLANAAPVSVVKNLTEVMTANGHQCSVFYFDEKTELQFACPVQRIDMKRAADFSGFDVVHSHCMRPDKYIWKHCAKGGKTRYISTIHCEVISDFTFQYGRIVALIYGNIWMRLWTRRHDKIVLLSKCGVEYYKRWFNAGKLTYAYNSRIVDETQTLTATEEQELLAFKGNHILIGMNSAPLLRKGADILISNLLYLPQYKLFIAGGGKFLKFFQQMAEKYGVSDRCYFAGYRKDAYRYLPFYDIFALPSRSEGFPLAMLEAAMYKKPCVVSDIPVFKEIFSGSEVSSFQLARPQSIVDAIERAAASPGLGGNLHRRYQECYSPQKFYERHLAIYEGRVLD